MDKEIDELIEEIIHLEEKIKVLDMEVKTKSQVLEDKINSINFDIKKNEEMVLMLKNYIDKENNRCEVELSSREDEKKRVNSMLSELEKKINERLNNNNKNEEDTRKFIEDAMKHKKLKQEAKEYNHELKIKQETKLAIQDKDKLLMSTKEELVESFMMLKEEKETIKVELMNLVTRREELEEILRKINIRSRLSLTTSTEMVKTVNVYDYELRQVDINKLSMQLYEGIVEVDSDKAYNLTMEQFVKYKLSNVLKFSEDPLELKLIKIIKEIQSTCNHIDQEIFMLYFKCLIKLNYFDLVITHKMNFLSKEYKVIKKNKINQINTINTKIEQIKPKLSELEDTILYLNSKLKMIDKQLKNINADEEYVSLTLIEDKLQNIREFKKSLDDEIQKIQKENKDTCSALIKQEEELRNLNKHLCSEVNNVENKAMNLKLNFNEEVKQIRQTIADKFNTIKLKLKDSNSEQKQKYYEDYISKMRRHDSSKDATSIPKGSGRMSSQLKDKIDFIKNLPRTERNKSMTYLPLDDCSHTNNTSSLNKTTRVIYKSNSKDKIKTIYQQEKEYLVYTIRKIKDKLLKQNTNIIHNEPTINQKLIPMFEVTTCYLRHNRKDLKKFNPLEDSLVDLKYTGYKNFSIILNMKMQIELNRSLDNSSITIDTKDVKMTIVSQQMKKCIEIYQTYNKMNQCYNQRQLDEFIKDDRNFMSDYDYTKRFKCISCKFFDFSIVLYDESRLDLIFLNFNDYKMWLNGLAYIIKSRNDDDIVQH